MYPSQRRFHFCEIWVLGPNPLYSRNFLPNHHLPVSTRWSSSWEKAHSEVQSNRRKKKTKPNRENRRVLFPLLSDFLKGWRQCTSWGIWTTSSSNSGCRLWHRAFWNPGYLYSCVSIFLQKELRFPVPASSPFDQFCSLFKQQQKYKIRSCHDSSQKVTRCPGLSIVRWLSHS